MAASLQYGAFQDDNSTVFSHLKSQYIIYVEDQIKGHCGTSIPKSGTLVSTLKLSNHIIDLCCFPNLCRVDS